jgi:hypothetical protein
VLLQANKKVTISNAFPVMAAVTRLLLESDIQVPVGTPRECMNDIWDWEIIQSHTLHEHVDKLRDLMHADCIERFGLMPCMSERIAICMDPRYKEQHDINWQDEAEKDELRARIRKEMATARAVPATVGSYRSGHGGGGASCKEGAHWVRYHVPGVHSGRRSGCVC